MAVAAFVLAVGVAMLGCEQLGWGRSWPRVRGWWARALLLNGVQVASVYVAGSAWDGWLVRSRLWSAEALGPIGGAVLGYLVITLIYYWWHRARHDFDFLWRWFHQLHHSPQRIEVITSFYKHPFEIFGNSVLSSVILYLLVGVGAEAATLAVLATGLAELFYHWNVSTPHWLGYIIQRPESHCVHHQEGLHSYNYGDLPVWDMLFGTFHNPRGWSGRCGFGASELRLGPMLLRNEIDEPQPSAEPA